MAITTLDGLVAGFKHPQFFFKALSGTLVAGRPWTSLLAAGIPGPATDASFPTTLAGSALTTLDGDIPFHNPTAGQSTYLARFVGMNNAQSGAMQLADMLWANGGITITSTAAQTVNSAAWPARDSLGTTDGQDVLLGVLVTVATGAGTPTITVSYTNSAGTAGRTGTNTVATGATSPVGTFYPISLQAGDVGVRSVQSITLSATWTSGTIRLVAYRPLAYVRLSSAGFSDGVDPVTGGMPQMFDNTVPFPIFYPGSTTSTILMGSMTVAQG